MRQFLLAFIMLFIGSLPTQASDSNQPFPLVVIRTDEGDITLRLMPDKAPITVANFLAHVEAGHYNGTIFHRVIPDFMIQGGGLLPDMSERPTGAPIENESRNRLRNTRATIAMARMNDPDSATAQFFINQRDNLQLDWTPGREGYTVFGEVVAGMSIVDYIATSPTHEVDGHGDVPVEPIIIRSIERVSLQ